ncbi:MAG: YggT family protein [Candidatus Promineifilaceae bacterium]
MLNETKEQDFVDERVSEGNRMPASPPTDRRERVTIVRDETGVREEHKVEDVGTERWAKLFKVSQFVWLVTGILELLIGLRIFLKLIAANPNNPFAHLVYSFTDLFLWPFVGLTVTPSANGMVLEISSIIAMLVYATVAWGFLRLLYLIFTPSTRRSYSIFERQQR